MYNLYAQYPRQQVCRDRQFSALLRWSAYIQALPIPTEKPSEQWVAERITAEQVPRQTEQFVGQTISGMVAVPDIQTNIREHLNAWNSEATETAMDVQVDAALAVIMPPFCAAYISQAQIGAWYVDNGFEEAQAPLMAGGWTPPQYPAASGIVAPPRPPSA